jgi:hypothetical protein
VTARELVRRAQRRLAATVLAAAVLWGAVLAMAVISLAAGADAIFALPPALRAALIPLAALAAIAAAMLVLWRGRAARSTSRVALWIEEHDPSLSYALVTAIDPGVPAAARSAELRSIAERADVSGMVGRAGARALGRAALACAILACVLAILQPGELLRTSGAALAHAGISGGASAPLPNRLLDLTARVTPPAYTRLPARVVKDPGSVASLIGSRIALSGSGPAGGVTADAGEEELVASAEGSGWKMETTMPREPLVLMLHDRDFKRLVALEAITDSAPNVKLRLPAHDTTWQLPPHGKLAIEARLTEDFGLDYGYVEYMLSTGAEESFETKVSNGPRFSFDNDRAGTLRATVDLDTMKLAPGSVLHIRVVAFDYNDVTGPGKGVSETRTLRVAEPIDSTSINAAPPLPIDSLLVSQRLLNMRTDTLIRNRRKLERKSFEHTSSGYSNVQESIRQRTLAVIGLLEDNGVGGSFETEASTKLREAAELMWTARMQLGIAQPDTAMPYMKKILAILDELRLAHRYYLRGLMKPVAVNVERVRLTGTDSADASKRDPRSELSDPHTDLVARLERVASIAATSPGAAADSLVFIRVAALRSAPAAASTLEEAIGLLRRGEPARAVLARVRRALEPRPKMESGAAGWAGVVP